MISISSSSSTIFSGPGLVIDTPRSHSNPSCIKYRPIRISASCTSTVDRPRSRIQPNSSLYDVLGIHTGATCQEIKSAYRRLARVVHPDVAANGQPGGQTSAADEFMKVHEAYATLSDAQKRADYDRVLFRRPRPTSYSFTMSATGRRWETDQCW